MQNEQDISWLSLSVEHRILGETHIADGVILVQWHEKTLLTDSSFSDRDAALLRVKMP